MGIGSGASPVGFILTRDLARAKAFYCDVLGCRHVSDDPFATVIDAHGLTVRITPIPDHTPGPHTVLGWEVPDLEASVAALKAAGVSMRIYEGFGQDADGVWTAPGGRAKICWFDDPDGNNLSLSCHA